jgi:hypothetical protein
VCLLKNLTIIFQTRWNCPKLVFQHFNTAWILLAEHQSEYCTLRKFVVYWKAYEHCLLLTSFGGDVPTLDYTRCAGQTIDI